MKPVVLIFALLAFNRCANGDHGRDWIMAGARMKRAIWKRKAALARITLPLFDDDRCGGFHQEGSTPKNASRGQ
jgi:hypothetical protein